MEAARLHLLRKTFLEAVTQKNWMDTETKIKGRLAVWRRCFPRTLAAKVPKRAKLEDSDFVHLQGV